MAANDCWGAFGSDSDDDDDDSVNSGSNTNGSQNQQRNPFEQVADTVSLSITQYFVSLTKSTGVLLQERVVGISQCSSSGNGYYTIMTERVGGRGMKIVKQSEFTSQVYNQCDAAILWKRDIDTTECSLIKQSLIPGGEYHPILKQQYVHYQTEDRIPSRGSRNTLITFTCS